MEKVLTGKGRNRKGVNWEFCILKVKGACAPAVFTGNKIKKVTKINYPCDSSSLGSRLCGQLSKIKTNACSLNLMKGQIAGYTHISRTCNLLGLHKLVYKIQVQMVEKCYLLCVFGFIYIYTHI